MLFTFTRTNLLKDEVKSDSNVTDILRIEVN